MAPVTIAVGKGIARTHTTRCNVRVSPYVSCRAINLNTINADLHMREYYAKTTNIQYALLNTMDVYAERATLGCRSPLFSESASRITPGYCRSLYFQRMRCREPRAMSEKREKERERAKNSLRAHIRARYVYITARSIRDTMCVRTCVKCAPRSPSKWSRGLARKIIYHPMRFVALVTRIMHFSRSRHVRANARKLFTRVRARDCRC